MEQPNKFALDKAVDARIEKIFKKKYSQLRESEKKQIIALAKDPRKHTIIQAFCESTLFKDPDSRVLKSLMLHESIFEKIPENVELFFSHGAAECYKGDNSLADRVFSRILWNPITPVDFKMVSALVRHDTSPAFLRWVQGEFESKVKYRPGTFNICYFHGYPIFRSNVGMSHGRELFYNAHARRVHRLAQYLNRCTEWPAETVYSIAEYRFGKLSPYDWKLIEKYPADDYKKVRTP